MYSENDPENESQSDDEERFAASAHDFSGKYHMMMNKYQMLLMKESMVSMTLTYKIYAPLCGCLFGHSLPLNMHAINFRISLIQFMFNFVHSVRLKHRN